MTSVVEEIVVGDIVRTTGGSLGIVMDVHNVECNDGEQYRSLTEATVLLDSSEMKEFYAWEGEMSWHLEVVAS